MGTAYSPGLKVSSYEVIYKNRLLPLKGDVMVKKGDVVKAEDVVARTFLPGNIEPKNIANILSVPPKEIRTVMLKKEGDKVEKGEPIALNSSFFGLFKTKVPSPITGTLESISEITGQVMLREPPIPVEVKAYTNGVVSEIIESEGCVVKTYGSFIQGIFGIGEERNGEIKIVSDKLDDVLDESKIKEEHKGKILVGGALVTYDAVKQAIKHGVEGIVVGGIDDHNLKLLLKKDLGVAITGRENIGITIVVTEGFGKISMATKTFELLKTHEGKFASINGATQIRAGVIRPEIIVPLEKREDFVETDEEKGTKLEIGSPIRIIREPYFGQIGRVTELPPQLTKVESGTMVRILRAELDEAKKEVMVPRANVEVIED